MIHFAVPPETIQDRVPLELDTREGETYITLVAFRQERLRVDRLGRLGALIALPVRSHAFLNVRAYVRRGDERGIYFLDEYIDNRAARLAGPTLYGLPYRLASLNYGYARDERRFSGHVDSGRTLLSWRAEYADQANPPAQPESEAHFLHERYLAFTQRGAKLRRFRVSHEPWRMRRATVEMRVEDEALAWLGEARFAGAWYSPLLPNVGLGAPERVEAGGWASARPAEAEVSFARSRSD